MPDNTRTTSETIILRRCLIRNLEYATDVVLRFLVQEALESWILETRMVKRQEVLKMLHMAHQARIGGISLQIIRILSITAEPI